jgi:hypothetical protein
VYRDLRCVSLVKKGNHDFILLTGKLLYMLRTMSLSHVELHWLSRQNRSSPISEPLWPTRGSLDANTFTGWEV